MKKEEILDKINNVMYWQHRIDLGDGVCTSGESRIDGFKIFELDGRLDGKSVLDIGAWDGGASFKAKELGAGRVLVTDVWRDPPNNKSRWENIRNSDEGFLCAREILNADVEQKNISIFDMTEETVGKFDIVLFLGVLYHLPHPLKALEIISAICNETVVLESAVFYFPPDSPNAYLEKEPLMKFRGEYGWFPNKECVEMMLRQVGFKKIEYPRTPNPFSNRDAHAGVIVRSVVASNFKNDAAIGNPLLPDTPVIILNTDRGNMDISAPEARKVRIQWSAHKFQGWIDKDAVQFLNQKPPAFYETKTADQGLKMQRLLLKAYK